jgi:hypothetical protein
MSECDDELRVRPVRLRDKSFVGQVTCAAKKLVRAARDLAAQNRAGASRPSALEDARRPAYL